MIIMLAVVLGVFSLLILGMAAKSEDSISGPAWASAVKWVAVMCVAGIVALVALEAVLS